MFALWRAGEVDAAESSGTRRNGGARPVAAEGTHMALANTAPIAGDDEFTVQQGADTTELIGSLRAGDSDPDGDALGWAGAGASLSGGFFSGDQLGFVRIVGPSWFPHPVIMNATTITTAGGGTVTIETDGGFFYRSAAGFSGVDWFDYTLIDSQFATDIGRVTINVTSTTGSNNLPVAVDDTFAGAEGQKIAGNLLADNGKGADFDPDGDALTVVNQTIATAGGGLVTILANGDFVYAPSANFSGADSFTYTLLDAKGARDTATVTLEVAAVNDAPVAAADSFAGSHGKPISGNVMTNDSDPEGNALHVGAATITTDKGGVVTLLEDGNFIYAPAATFAGADSFTYTLFDDAGATDVGTVSLNVTNRAPSAGSDFLTGVFGNPVTGNVLANDSDADGDALSVVPMSATTANGGTVKLAADGNFTFTPAPAFAGSDSFTYSVTDDFGGRSSATAVITYAAPPGARLGTNGDDRINGTSGNDNIFAQGGEDTVSGQGGNDTIAGGAGRDTLNGDAGIDTLNGDAGRDTLNGGADNDLLYGGADADTLNGGNGNDQLFGAAGADDLTGGAGAYVRS
jgi:hypothetical protein